MPIILRNYVPDSKIAHSFSSGKTKTTAIIKHAIAPSLNSIVAKACQQSPITILCDGGSDQLGKNILVRYWDEPTNHVATRFLALPISDISASEALFEALALELSSRYKPWENIIGYTSDTANVMVGKRNSVLSRLKLKQLNMFILGCLCHLAALKKLPISIDTLLIEILYHFKYSAKPGASLQKSKKNSKRLLF